MTREGIRSCKMRSQNVNHSEVEIVDDSVLGVCGSKLGSYDQ